MNIIRSHWSNFMRKMMRIRFAAVVLCLACATILAAEPAGGLGTIPRVELHAHLDSIEMADTLMQVADLLKERHQIHIAAFINLQSFMPVGDPAPLTPEFFDAVERRYHGRILSCIGDYNVPRGLQYTPDSMAAWQQRGVVGYKIWYPVVTGPHPPAPDQFTVYAPDYPGIDCPANEPVFAAMERLGLVGTCLHIGQAHPRRWKDPVHYWTALQSWIRVLDRHPRMVVVMGHMMNLFYSDEQLDFLAYVLGAYPNVHLEFGGRFLDFKKMSRDHLRDFIIGHADRIMFGSDVSKAFLKPGKEQAAAHFYYEFQMLESDGMVPKTFAETPAAPDRGLGLPRDVLEKIYYKNAVRLYPRLKTVLRQQGFQVE